MTLLGLIGILIAVAGFRFARAGESRSRLVLFVLLLLAHLGASIAYFIYAQAFGGDVDIYYYDPYGIHGQRGLSTVFVVNLVQTLKEYFGGSLLDYFMLFQAIGFWGILFILRTFDDIHNEVGQPTFSRIYLLLFLPGLHFWTSAVGKDSPIFLGVAMCVWAAFRLQTRYLAFVAGLAIAVLFRPHITLIALVGLALTVLFARKTSILTRVALLVVVAAGIGSVGGLVSESFGGLNISNSDAVTEFIETKSSVSEESGGDVNIINASFPLKLISLLFRPFFIDATGLLGYVASLENLVLLLVIGTLAWRSGTSLALARTAFFARFAALFFFMMTILLAMVNYNVGLGLRQKMMMMPALLVFFAALMAVRRLRKGTVYGPGAAAYAGAPPAGRGYRRA
ncbi:MAG TPA: hypothetical protein VE053_10740 [Allosphingosinicella sp.]|nr:hypothetical protein [Allosphingosinicella sp.]